MEREDRWNQPESMTNDGESVGVLLGCGELLATLGDGMHGDGKPGRGHRCRLADHAAIAHHVVGDEHRHLPLRLGGTLWYGVRSGV